MFKNFNKVKRELVHSRYLCAFIPDELTPFKNGVSLSELWLLRAWEKTGYLKKADGKKGLYIPVHQVLDEKQFSAHLKMIKEEIELEKEEYTFEETKKFLDHLEILKISNKIK